MEEGFETGNIAQLLFKRAAMHPDRLALHIPRGLKGEEKYTYQELSDRVLRLMAGLRSEGIRKGDRVLVLFPVCTDLYALIAAIYAVGGVALLIDPGMGARRITQALGTAKPKAMVSVQALFRFRFILPALWKITIKFSLDSTGWGVRPFADLLRKVASSVYCLVHRKVGEQELINFTWG
ncbi:MAG: AMP-binding protein [Myxococcota bacterium]|nr:AMP-binding protein [Myxococcota bacterium]